MIYAPLTGGGIKNDRPFFFAGYCVQAIFSGGQCFAFYFYVFVNCKQGCLVSPCSPYFIIGDKIAPDLSSLHAGAAVINNNISVFHFACSSCGRTCRCSTLRQQ